MAITTTPFLDLEQILFSFDRAQLDRAASRYVQVTATVVARRRRVPTDRYRVVMAHPPTSIDATTTTARANDPASGLASRVHAA